MELNAETVKRALECCSEIAANGLIYLKCSDCPYDLAEEECRILDRLALALIKSQEQRIKELTDETESLKQAMEHEHASFMETFGEYGEKCERLANEKYDIECSYKSLKKDNDRLHETCTEFERKCAILNDENERLMKALNTDISVVRLVSRGSGKTDHLHEVMRIKVDAVRAAAVREFAERLTILFDNDETLAMVEVDAEYINEQIGNIAKEMLEGKDG